MKFKVRFGGLEAEATPEEVYYLLMIEDKVEMVLFDVRYFAEELLGAKKRKQHSQYQFNFILSYSCFELAQNIHPENAGRVPEDFFSLLSTDIRWSGYHSEAAAIFSRMLVFTTSKSESD